MANHTKLDMTTKLYNACVLLLRACTEEEAFYDKHKETAIIALRVLNEADQHFKALENTN